MWNGELVTKIFVWMSLVAYAATLVSFAIDGQEAVRRTSTRWCWTLGCWALWCHVIAAFHVYHHWSHAAAVDHTARETAAVVGIRWGGGIWFNYLLLAVWTLDVAWWWGAPVSYENRNVTIMAAVQGYVAFMVFNAVIVFESGPLRTVAITAVLVMAVLWRVGRRIRRHG